MRRTPALLRQHIGWHFQNHWRIQGKRKILDTVGEKILKEKGVQIIDPNQFLREKVVHERVEVIGYKNKPVQFDETHPNWHEKPLLTYRDNNVLLEGLTQAKILTNTVEMKEGLPETMQLPELSKEFNRKVKKIILGAHIFDAEQQKLPKIKDPARPAFNFPRAYGVTQKRVFQLLISKLLNLIETSSNYDLVRERYLANDVYFQFPFKRNETIIQFQISGDTVMLSLKPLSPVTRDSAKEFDLPDIFPIVPTITLNEENVYVVETLYPITSGSPKFHPHTIFVNYNNEEVKNLYEEEVTETQICGRSLLKTFTAAASYARQRYGNDVKTLPSPIVLQCIQTDGKTFYFGVLQLNTLDLESSVTRNVWYQTPGMSLFDICAYQVGKPVLQGYNQEVARHMLAFYNTV